MISYTIDSENNQLIITADADGQEELEDAYTKGGHPKAEQEVIEAITGNGLSYIAPEQIGALTDAPIFGDIGIGDDGEVDYVGDVFWFPNYMITDPWKELAETGRVVFDGQPKS